MVLVAVLHGLALWLLLQLNIIQLSLKLPVLSVDLIEAPTAPQPPKPKIEPPRPRPLDKRPALQPVQETATLALPTEAPVAAPTAMPSVAVSPEPTFSPPAPPAETVKPRFDADYLDNPRPTYPP
ncbi:MAG: hypothetical protein N2690_05080, partial [Rhodocyclaceae bacterium]|nr:hypothetical protein [Rhodocyclaceae bacterium]